MSETGSARIAVLADTSLQRHVLQQALSASGYRVVLNTDPARLEVADLEGVGTDLWLVDLAQSEDCPLVDALLEWSSAPVLFGEGHAPERLSENYPRWERRLFGKLKRLVGDPSTAVGPRLEALLEEAQRPGQLALPRTLAETTALSSGEPARQVWLLAASMGGPEAVKAFLDALPGGLPVGFVYAQHIEASFEASLPQAVGRHSQWYVTQARQGDAIRCGEVVVAPIQHELGFAAGSVMQIANRGWPEPYSPSIDQMMLNLAQHFASRCGVIAFSGMGSDGSAAAAYVRRQGGKIWTQRADSCVCSSMPDSLREGGYSLLSGDPRELAQALVDHLAEQLADSLSTTPQDIP
ncbi:chemotaxis protein CheB [Stutzerimonas azotifigens]|uniref:protein-glutamate methylesterase n=1 Tax=Stutzerimonas azotifigens TaxID=291995 RepID=A0ABR5Z0H1_9GAMM|nr:chemotaxis protein CheB [Stutzerimonas azotifigens]MBA1273662.1 chemotaxis protein CheB [Stutzerimonas azotifigens]